MREETERPEEDWQAVASLPLHSGWKIFSKEIRQTIDSYAGRIIRMDPQKELVEIARLQGAARALEILIVRPEEIRNKEKFRQEVQKGE